MKKFIILLLAIIPINVFAYSNYIIPGGNTVGIDVKNKGIIVIGYYVINNKINQNNLQIGDIITKVNNKEVYSIEELINEIEKEVNDNLVYLTIERNNKELIVPFKLHNINGKYKTGLYVKDNISGIGTLTYIDPETKIFGALGHEIIESNTGYLIEVNNGSIFRSSITGIDKSTIGSAGTKNAKFYSNEKYGEINKNTYQGIYGIYTSDISNMDTLEVGNLSDIEKGKAYIYTVLDKENINKYEIEIDRINPGNIKNIHFIITDNNLINKTGGIVQGMSGSPIIQNNKIIGAVTHVIVDNPTTGYGISIVNMLEEGDKLLNKKTS